MEASLEREKQALLKEQLMLEKVFRKTTEPIYYEQEEGLYNRVREFIEANWDPEEPEYLDVLASTVLLSYRVEQFQSVPYPFLFGAPDSGKSQALNLLRVLCYRAIKSSTITPAAIFQTLDRYKPTLLIDETDKWGVKGAQNERVLELLQVLNSGYTVGDVAVRASRDTPVPTVYSTFGLKVLSGTEKLPDTLMQRCIILRCSENVKDIPLDFHGSALDRLQGELEEYHNRLGGTACTGLDVDPEELKREIGDNRVTQLFLSLYIVCPTVEGRKALLKLAKETVLERRAEEGTGDLARVLEAVWTLKAEVETLGEPCKVLAVKTIAERYNKDLDEGEKRSSDWIGRKLAKLGFKPSRIGNRTLRGVLVDEKKLGKAVRRYARHLLDSGPSGTSVNTRDTKDTSPEKRDPQTALSMEGGE